MTLCAHCMSWLFTLTAGIHLRVSAVCEPSLLYLQSASPDTTFFCVKRTHQIWVEHNITEVMNLYYTSLLIAQRLPAPD